MWRDGRIHDDGGENLQTLGEGKRVPRAKLKLSLILSTKKERRVLRLGALTSRLSFSRRSQQQFTSARRIHHFILQHERR